MDAAVMLLRIYPQGKEEKEKQMENFVLAGKAKTVFRLIELKAKREEAARRDKKRNNKNKK